MTTLADKSLLSGGDNKPPMLEKHLYDSWKSRMELYMMNRPHGRMILASVEKGPLVWPSITEDGVTRLKEYVELTPAEAIQADCDIKAINIILQGLPTEIYALVSQHRVAKDLWEKIKLLMQGTSLTKQRTFTLLLNDIEHLQDAIVAVQVNTNSYTPHPDEWSKFVIDVKLVKDLHTTNVDQLHAHLQQHERHANEDVILTAVVYNPGILLPTSAKTLVKPSQQAIPSMMKSDCATCTGGIQTTYPAGNNKKNTHLVQVVATRETTDLFICYNAKGRVHIAQQMHYAQEEKDETCSTIKCFFRAQDKCMSSFNRGRNSIGWPEPGLS
ncbi:hypothetical protein Tco_0786168 [Tanacetum coccineum]